MPEECNIVRNPEGYLVDSCTGEVVDFENYAYQDYSNLEYYEKVSSQKREAEKKEIRDMKKIVLNYLVSIMTEDEKEIFYDFLNRLDTRVDAATYLALYEYVLEKEGKPVLRNYIDFIKAKGIGIYSIRQRKKLLRKALSSWDPVVQYIKNEYDGDRQEALRTYELLKKYGLVTGKAEKRKKTLIKYLENERLKKELFEKKKMEEIENTLLMLNIRDFENVFSSF
ncbi:hypothetical protein WIW89_00275 [Stygiolobus sp. CP850M]|jgi:hypothetical protein|uniref:hypothetical protein n=1 Tax=Stygiolobus sp. CP850M TaxID=3133134 RepID=UPI00307EA96B